MVGAFLVFQTYRTLYPADGPKLLHVQVPRVLQARHQILTAVLPVAIPCCLLGVSALMYARLVKPLQPPLFVRLPDTSCLHMVGQTGKIRLSRSRPVHNSGSRKVARSTSSIQHSLHCGYRSLWKALKLCFHSALTSWVQVASRRQQVYP